LESYINSDWYLEKRTGKAAIFCQYQYCVAKADHVRAEKFTVFCSTWQYTKM